MSFFKAYDMRGTYGVDFDLDTVYRVGLALPRVVGGPRWLVGRDARTTSDKVHQALVAGLLDAGVDVTDLGLSTTPMVYFFTAEEGFDGSVMITASHNPPSDNGLKVSKKTALPVGYSSGLDKVEELVRGELKDVRFDASRKVEPPLLPDALKRYIAWQKAHNPTWEKGGLKVAVDCSSGMASLFARELFPGAVILNDTLDGTFPCHSPNPLNAAAREEIARVVREKGLDLGIIFDGDADRAMVVDEKGEFVQPDYLIPAVARATIPPGAKAPKVIHDVRTSRGTIEALKEMGCEPVMVPVGHAFAKPILREVGAACGGELAGHYYFSEFFGCDSGLLAALRVLAAAGEAKGVPFSQFVAPVRTRYHNSGELNFKVADKEKAIARVLDAAQKGLPADGRRTTIDGIRIDYPNGWFSIRASNTEPYLRLIVETATADELDAWRGILSGAIERS